MQLAFAAQALASASGQSLDHPDADQVASFEPEWTNNRCEIQSLPQLLGAN